MEERIMQAMCESLNLIDHAMWPRCIIDADNDVSNNEMRDCLTDGAIKFPGCVDAVKRYLNLTGPRLEHDEAEKVFLARYKFLTVGGDDAE